MIKAQNLTDLIDQPARLVHEILQIYLIVFCNISAELSGYFADNRAKWAYYNKKLTRPALAWLAHS
jgi:hypothetical protein